MQLKVRELQTPVVLALVDDHSHYLGHDVVQPLNASVAVWMVGVVASLWTPKS